MTRREMTATDIARRIGQGDLVVYLSEEYGYRQWFWFPGMSESDLETFWEKCNIEDYFFNPSNLPGDVVPVPPEDVDEDELDNHYDRAMSDPRSEVLREGTNGDAEKWIADYNEWRRDWFPNEAMWVEGFQSKDVWRAHTHMADDSWLKKPGD